MGTDIGGVVRERDQAEDSVYFEEMLSVSDLALQSKIICLKDCYSYEGDTGYICEAEHTRRLLQVRVHHASLRYSEALGDVHHEVVEAVLNAYGDADSILWIGDGMGDVA